jgi:hypothetical protein
MGCTVTATAGLRCLPTAAMLTSLPLLAAERTAIPPTGRVSVSGTVAKRSATVTLDVVRIGRESPCLPPSQDQTVRQVSIVKALTIVVGGREIFVARSVFLDWLDPRDVSVVDGRGEESSLSVLGGDGADTYEIRVFFDATRVTKRVVYSALIPTEPTEETRYWTRVLRDR